MSCVHHEVVGMLDFCSLCFNTSSYIGKEWLQILQYPTAFRYNISDSDVIHILLYPTIYVNVNIYCSSTFKNNCHRPKRAVRAGQHICDAVSQKDNKIEHRNYRNISLKKSKVCMYVCIVCITSEKHLAIFV